MPLSFHPVDQQALSLIRPYFDAQTQRFCDATIGTAYMWRTYYQEEYAIVHGCLLSKATADGEIYFGYPLGNGDKEKALTELELHCMELGIPLQFCTVSLDQTQGLLERYGKAITVEEDEDSFDYLYHYEDLATFAGRRYSAQRNHINQFEKKWPDWAYHPLLPTDVPAILAFLNQLEVRKSAKEPLSSVEQADIAGSRDLLAVMHDHGLTGGFITVEGEIVAFSVGERQGDTLYVHIEKGDIRYSGVYQLMVREYAAHNGGEGLMYINREDDSGDPGLRRSKLSYHPCDILKKYVVYTHR